LKALIDTGAVHSSYVNYETAKKLQQLGLLYIPSNKKVCTGLNNASCTHASKSYDIELTFLNELTNKKELLIIRAQVIDSRYDLIIGYPDIFDFELTSKFPSLFSKSWVENQKKKDFRKRRDPNNEHTKTPRSLQISRYLHTIIRISFFYMILCRNI
jgi:hypothetical protein